MHIYSVQSNPRRAAKITYQSLSLIVCFCKISIFYIFTIPYLWSSPGSSLVSIFCILLHTNRLYHLLHRAYSYYFRFISFCCLTYVSVFVHYHDGHRSVKRVSSLLDSLLNYITVVLRCQLNILNATKYPAIYLQNISILQAFCLAQKYNVFKLRIEA